MKRLLYIEPGEAFEILVSVVAISLAFTIFFAGIDNLFSSPKEFFVFMSLSLVTIGTGFILHEMGHKLVAIYYGAYARFQMWTQGLIFMLLASPYVLFAAPGAVYIYSQSIDKKQNGIISIAGPAVNFAIMLVFFILSLIIPRNLYFSFDLSMLDSLFSGGAFEVWRFGAYINFILCMFNMIPAFPLDGSKVFGWSKLTWAMFLSLVFITGLSIGIISLGFAIMWMVMLFVFVLLSTVLFGQRKG